MEENIYGKKSGKRILKDLVNFPPKDYPRRTKEGYPSELVYDEFSYERMIGFYRRHIKAALKRLK